MKQNSAAATQLLNDVSSQVKFSSRDEIEMTLSLSGQKIIRVEIKSVACPECLAEIKKLKENLKAHSDDYSQMPLPKGSHHSAILIRELIMKSRQQWSFPYKELELCHCRQIATETVDASIIGGVHRVSEIGERTMAGTACGTCRPVSQMLIDYRLGDDED